MQHHDPARKSLILKHPKEPLKTAVHNRKDAKAQIKQGDRIHLPFTCLVTERIPIAHCFSFPGCLAEAGRLGRRGLAHGRRDALILRSGLIWAWPQGHTGKYDESARRKYSKKMMRGCFIASDEPHHMAKKLVPALPKTAESGIRAWFK
jgi:hypothetical protein